ncbi:diacylglycerol kinase family protein [Oceanobacillus sp. J11TS1]|uniref:diacylglycerol kinase family protein n=1 Tax=Oceanobacillus sp. J11TS1 TaxID=2807191 RepID=UPI001B223BAA|nr:diacylglycerol kinase family protein [Oceanobacillus sp. J11TS1]GIO23102.1 diacylglycerol kinase [Oceanobacillus sp. J11TS1]
MKDKKRNVGFRFAWIGLKTVVKKEFNFQLHLIATAVVTAFGIFFSLSLTEWAIILLTISLVLITEMINSIIERVMDFIQPNYDDRIKEIKDIAAGVVLVTAIISVVVGILIFGPKIIQLL